MWIRRGTASCECVWLSWHCTLCFLGKGSCPQQPSPLRSRRLQPDSMRYAQDAGRHARVGPSLCPLNQETEGHQSLGHSWFLSLVPKACGPSPEAKVLMSPCLLPTNLCLSICSHRALEPCLRPRQVAGSCLPPEGLGGKGSWQHLPLETVPSLLCVSPDQVSHPWTLCWAVTTSAGGLISKTSLFP